MAVRPIFVPSSVACEPVCVKMVEFTWYPGLSLSQKRRSIRALHTTAQNQYGVKKILEISSKSDIDAGRQLSAFQLSFRLKGGGEATVEAAFQGSKVFEKGGPYTDLCYRDALGAKRDKRLKESGQLLGFRANGRDWPLEPKTLFYDWIYINALLVNPALSQCLIEYEAFTDIEFNPKKSFNCQAHSAAAYVQLSQTGRLAEVMSSVDAFQDCFAGCDEVCTEQSQLGLSLTN